VGLSVRAVVDVVVVFIVSFRHRRSPALLADGDVNVVAVVYQYRRIVDDFRALDGVGGEVLVDDFRAVIWCRTRGDDAGEKVTKIKK
jgi:hypothetical protein